jgi:hypothetical protein
MHGLSLMLTASISRFVSPEGLLVGVTFTPAMREKK